jgi:tRNA threonylcarbamoyladenosine biosynthesis protein TsaE
MNLPDLAATDAFGHHIAQGLFPGAVAALIGPMGAGKTHLVRAIVEGLGGDPRQVSSPTYTLIHEYHARLPVYHFDAYRLRSPDEFRDLGAHEYFSCGGVCLIEWADRVLEYLPIPRIEIHLIPSGATSREVTVTQK